eukprot:TRINITY_DN22533_c0_g1_i5.p1 TRINITY_DN22533_c0_g1~~TRINITY_DN22533_c0_g1_i5.p1  ORF type:complete len:175 (+),score=6.89 TRINITY_DN22533_c0_g1_i5:157-681(+)
MMISVSFALAQSARLSVDEEVIGKLANECNQLQIQIFKTRYEKQRWINGYKKDISTEVSKLMGRIFLSKSRVNLASPILDTPEYLWSKPDYCTNMYMNVFQYMEMNERVKAVNDKLEVLTSMLTAVRSGRYQQDTILQARIVMWLMIACVIIAVWQIFQLLLNFHSYKKIFWQA